MRKETRNAKDVALAKNQELIVVDHRAGEVLNVITVKRQSDAANDVERRQA